MLWARNNTSRKFKFSNMLDFAVCTCCMPSRRLRRLHKPCDIDISELDIYNDLKSLDPSKASDCDGISANILKKCAIALYQPLQHLFS